MKINMEEVMFIKIHICNNKTIKKGQETQLQKSCFSIILKSYNVFNIIKRLFGIAD